MGVIESRGIGLLERYREFLPVSPATPQLTLGEGGTPLLHAPKLSERLGVDLRLKCEGLNPTGSFKDRGMVVAVAKAVEEGASAVVCASTGNTAASAAAYAARAGIKALILQPAGANTTAKQAQARVTGAELRDVTGTFDDALRQCLAVAASGSHVLVNSLNPYRGEGQKTAAFEIVEELGRAPDVVALPYGGGGNLGAYIKGFAEFGQGEPRLIAGESSDRPHTAASAIRIAEPAHADEVAEAVASGRAEVVCVTDEEIVEAWLELAQLEGVFCELSSATGLAALKRSELAPGSLAVCILTGHGLKDTGAVEQLADPR
jgi:threonine synthase